MKKLINTLIFFAAASSAFAEAPNLLTYQGRLKEGGQAVTGNRSVDILLCDAEPSGTGNCYSSGAQGVYVSNGLFRSTFTVPAGANLDTGSWWLELKVGADILEPRERLGSNVYALFAGTAAYASNIAAAEGSNGVYISSNLYVTGGFAVGASTLVVINSRVGIGEASPQYPLHVQAPAGQPDALYLKDSGQDVGMILMSQVGYNANIRVPNTGSGLTLQVGNSPAVHISSAWNAGFGTINPYARVHISSGAGEAGNMLLISTGSSDVIRLTGGGEIYANKYHGDGSALQGIVASGGVLKAGDTMTGQLTVTSSLTVTGSDGVFGLVVSSNISAAGGLLNARDGRLGIGTASPAAGLHVYGADATAATVRVDGAANSYLRLGGGAGAYSALEFYEGGTQRSMIGWQGTDDTLRVYAGGGDNLVIDVNGRTGLGTATPDQKLTVSGNISQTGVLISSGTGDNYFAGRIGVGTDAPSYQLHVESAGEAIFGKSTSGNSTDAAVRGWTNNGAAAIKGVASSGYAGQFEGNVYIGGAPPVAGGLLQVKGATSDNTAAALTAINSGDASLLYVRNDGSVGVGTASPGYRLDVQGGYLNASGGLCIADSCKNSWASVADNLGNHTATQVLQMGAYGVTSSSFVSAGIYQVSGSTVLALRGTAGIMVGQDSGQNNTGSNNAFFGANSGYSNSAGGNNVFLGASAGYDNTYGAQNAFVGTGAGQRNTTGSDNLAAGALAAYENITGSGNTVLGAEAARSAPGNSFSSSTLVGYKSGYALQDGSYGNVLLGFQSGDSLQTGSRNIIIGYDADATAPTISDELNIGNLIWGRLATGGIGIGNPNTLPLAALDVKSTGTASNIYAQVWKNDTGTIIASMTSTGNLQLLSAAPVTTDPMLLLADSSNAGEPQVEVRSNNYRGRISIAGTNGGMYIGTLSNSFVSFQANTSEWMRLTTDGKLGIGTGSPDSTLEVSGNAKIARYHVEAADAGKNLTSDDFGKTLTVNSGTAQTITLPAVTAADIGAQVTVVKLGAGKVTVAATGAYIADSTLGGSIYNNAVTPAYATLTLRLVTATQWMLVGGEGSWITN